MTGGDIRELRLLADLEDISQRYEMQFGAKPINLSNWDPAPSISKSLELRLPTSADLSGIDYVFSYDIEEQDELSRALGFKPTMHGCLVTHSGSAAIVSVANWLCHKGCKHVLIVGPRYFTVPYALTSLGIRWSVAYARRSADGHYSLPNIEEEFPRIDAVWITNPVYCTSVDYDAVAIEEFILDAVNRGKKVVVDECLSEFGRQIAPRLPLNSIAAIYAPHKSICVNGIKFAAVFFESSEQTHFDTWCDVWNGCIPVSSVIAIRHFLSEDFKRYQRQFRAITARNHDLIREIVARAEFIAMDQPAEGYLISIFAPRIDAYVGTDFSFLSKATTESGAIFISGARNELDPNAGLSFRVNLAAMDTAALGALSRLCSWLNNHHS